MIFQQRPGLRAAAVYRIALLLYRMAGRLATRIWFTNPNDRTRFVSLGIIPSERTLLTGNAITLSEYSREAVSADKVAALRHELGLKPEDVLVLMVGRLIRAKGVLEYLESASIVRRRFPHARFLLVAPAEEGAPDEVPVADVLRRQESGDFQWLGFRRDLRDLYAVVDIGVLPSWYQEGGYPRALLEPMAFGCPVIAADTESCRNPVEPGVNGYLVVPQNIQSLAEAISRLVGDPELRKQFGARSKRKIIEQFDDLTVATSIADYIKSSIRTHS